MSSLVTIWAYEPPKRCIHGYEEACERLQRHETFDTTQVCLLNEPWIREYDYVVVVDSDGVVLFTNDHEHKTWSCIYTGRELRHVHNLFHLWRAGEFQCVETIWNPEESNG